MKFITRFFSLIALLCFSATIAFAQPPSGDGGGEDPDAIPIDGGVSFLLAGGAAYGIKIYRDQKKSKLVSE